MIDDIEDGKINCVVTKDLSRLGRNYIMTGQYTEIYFPSKGVRYIAVNDNVDTLNGESELAPFLNILNDFYAKDTSKKVRSVMKARGTSGKHLGGPPCGYRSDPQDKDRWILDEDAAPVVKRIFDLTIVGGPSRIARILESDNVLTAKALYAQRKGKPAPERPCHWPEQSVVGILERMEYTGCVCNFKTYSKSYKLKKRISNAKEDMFILPDTQEAIIPQEQWDQVQELRKNKRRITKGERQGLFSGLLFCADCGSKLNFATCNRFEGRQDRYICAKYRSGRGACSGHIIREEVLRDVVLERIRAVTEMVRSDVEGFQEDWLQCRREDQEKSIREDKRRLAQAKKRLADIDVLVTRIYEDMVLGNLSQERYQKMAESYETEQASLNNGNYLWTQKDGVTLDHAALCGNSSLLPEALAVQGFSLVTRRGFEPRAHCLKDMWLKTHQSIAAQGLQVFENLEFATNFAWGHLRVILQSPKRYQIVLYSEPKRCVIFDNSIIHNRRLI